MNMPTVWYDDRSYMVDEQRVWLSSGSIHYFRVPRELWRDRLLKAKRAGLNCITTYVAWNVHEPAPGEWNFEGQADIREFILEAQSLGLYVILRPGPYICGEWDFGGFPAWLAAKSGLTLRTSNATFMHYFDKYLGQLLPRLADLQVTHGGPIILVQNENEYHAATMPDRINYGQFISQLIRRSGYEVPIITCNWLSEPQFPETVECYNGWGREVQGLKRLRAFQPDAPMLATEFWTGWFDYWGGEHNTKDPAETARRALEILGCGCQVNYYMWHGGTNFGFYGSQLSATDASYQTTSYDYDAPLAEGGGLTEKYFLTKLVNMMATHFGRVFAQARMVGPAATVHSGTEVLNVAGPAGRMAVVTSNGCDEVEEADISLPDGRELTVALEPLGATAVPIDVTLSPDHKLDYANLMPLGVFGESGALVLHGPADFEARIGVNGREITADVPDDDEPLVIDHRGLPVVIMNSDLAQRSWAVEGSLIIGPEFIGETAEDIVPVRGAKQYAILPAEGPLTHRKLKPVPRPKPTAPRLGSFTRTRVCDEPINADLDWAKQDGPRDLAATDVMHGYGWVQLTIDLPKAARKHLYLPECEDRAAVYVNGTMAGIWGRGPGAKRSPMSIALKRGPNRVVFLLDNLGRHNHGPKLGSHKGLFGHAWDAKPIKLKKFKLTAGGEFSRRMIPRTMSQVIEGLEAAPLWTAELAFDLPKIFPVHLSYSDVPHNMVVLCNDRQAAFFGAGGGSGDVMLGNELKRGKNRLKLLIWGDVDAKTLENINLHLLLENLSAKAKWARLPWGPPSGEGRVVGKGLPAWYSATFKCKDTATPLFLRILAAKKGHIFLNGHNVGRFWSIGPQECYYLPGPWLAAENELLIFEEQGHIPSGSRLEYRPQGPYRP